jgi:hypothetical protein
MRLLRSTPTQCCWQGASRWVIQGGGEDANPVEHAEDGKVDDIARHAPRVDQFRNVAEPRA